MKINTYYSKNVKSLSAVVSYRKKLKTALKEFNKKKFSKQNIRCPFCQKNQSIIYFKIDIVIYKKCIECDSLYVSPRPSQITINKFYKFIHKKKIYINSLPKKFNLNRIKHIMLPRWNLFMNEINKIKKKKFHNYLEVGAGIGYFTKISINKKISKNYSVIEPDNFAVKQLIKISNKIKIFEGTLENYQIKKGEKKFDIVFINSVIEHPQNLNLFFQKLRSLVTKNCILILHDMHAGGLDVKLLKEQTPNYNAYNILQVGSVKGIELLLRRSKFKLIKVMSTGTMDTDIIYENLIMNAKNSNNFEKRIKEIFKDKNFREKFQELLKKNFLTGYNTYFFKPF